MRLTYIRASQRKVPRPAVSASPWSLLETQGLSLVELSWWPWDEVWWWCQSPSWTLFNRGDCSPPDIFVQGISQEKYWRGLSFLPPGDLPDPEMELPGIKLASPVRSPVLQTDSLLLSYLRSSHVAQCGVSGDGWWPFQNHFVLDKGQLSSWHSS